MSSNKTKVSKDFKARSVQVTRTFDAPVEDVWRAFTEKELLDQWWGPAPWRAETKYMDFKVGGYWLYAMVGPEGERHWGRMDYHAIAPRKSFDFEDAFGDENGKINKEMPVSKGHTSFTKTADGTEVSFKMIYPTEESLKQIVEMGFEEGISVGFDQLDALLEKTKVSK